MKRELVSFGPAMLNVRQVGEMFSLSRASIYKGVALGRFPAPVKMIGRAVRWPRDLLDRWRTDGCPPMPAWQTGRVSS